jgi:hypothetical protein
MPRSAPALAVIAALAAGCGGTRTVAQTVTQTVPAEPVTVTVTAPATAGGSDSSGYAPGYPKAVPVSETPEQMRDYLPGPIVVAVAPGVWARRNPGTTVREDADSGPLIGWCSSVDKFTRETGRDDAGTCW